MAGKKGRDQLNWKAFVSGLQHIIESLPTESEKKEFDDRLTQIVEFIMDLQSKLAAIPAKEQAGGVSGALQRLEDLVSKAKASPTLTAALGMKFSRPSRAVAAPFTDEEKQRADRLLGELRTLPIDELRTNLENETLHSSRELHCIAGLLGIRVTSKTARDTLTHSIAMKIANYRGYQHLRGEPESPAVEEHEKAPGDS